MNEVRYLFGEFTKIRVTTTVSFTSDWVINAKTEQIRPEFLRLLSQTNSQQITPHLCSLQMFIVSALEIQSLYC